MSDKPDPRLNVDLPVRVFGMDADGRPFLHQAQIRNISHHGARLYGLEARLKPGDVIAVQIGESKARCKVIWVVDAGAKKIEAGVNLIEGQPCPWEKELQSTDPAAKPATRTAPADENKRKFPRHRVPFPIEIRDQDAVGSHMKTQSADISGQGCYIETTLPLPLGRALNVTFWLDSERVSVPAIVKCSDGGVGMGIEFTGLDERAREQLQQQIESLATAEKPSADPG